MNIPSVNHSLLMNSNSNLNSVNSFTKYSTLMDYLVKKLEARIKMFPKTRTAIGNIYTQQDLIENKKEMVKHFYEIEDDLKQGVDAIKALLSQNRDLTEQLEMSSERACNHEVKSIGDLNIMNELNDRNNVLIDECNMMKKKFCEIQEKSSHLQEKISEFKDEFENKERLIQELTDENKYNCDRIEKIIEENIFLRMKIEGMTKENKNLDNRKINLEDRNYLNENSIGNLNSIIAEKEKNKRLIEEKIKTHFHNKFSEGDDKIKIADNANNFLQKTEMNSDTSNINQEDKYLKNNIVPKNPKNGKLISNIIMMALESEDNINYLNKKFGTDFIEKLLSPDVSDIFLKKIEESLKIKNNFNKNDSENNKNKSYHFDEEFNCLNDNELNKDKLTNKESFCENKKIEGENYSIHDYSDKRSVQNSIDKISKSSDFSSKRLHKRSLSSGVTKTKIKKGNLLNFPKGSDYKAFDTNISFQNTLRNYRMIRSPSTGKVFVNFTNPHGNFFDDSLQKGGKSKLKNRLMKSR